MGKLQFVQALTLQFMPVKLDIYSEGSLIVVVHETMSYIDVHLFRAIPKSFNAWESYSPQKLWDTLTDRHTDGYEADRLQCRPSTYLLVL